MAENLYEWKLGDHVQFDWADVLVRQEVVEFPLPATERTKSRITSRWKRNRHAKSRQREGVIVGIRTIVDGYNTHIYSDEPAVFMPLDYLRVYLVAYDMRRNPVRLHLEDVRP